LTIDTKYATSELLQDVYATLPCSTAKQNKEQMCTGNCSLDASLHLLVGRLLLQMHYYLYAFLAALSKSALADALLYAFLAACPNDDERSPRADQMNN